MDTLRGILAALERRRARPTVRGILSEGEEAYWRAPQAMQRESPIKTLLLRLVSESWTRPPGILSASASWFDIIVMDAERAFRKSVEDFGAAEWRAVAIFQGSMIDRDHFKLAKRRGRPRKLDCMPFGEHLVYQKPRGRPLKYAESYRRLIVQAVDEIKSKKPGRWTDKAAIAELFKHLAASKRRRPSAYAKDAENLARRLPEWRRQFHKIGNKSR